jgi:hypothetical protein
MGRKKATKGRPYSEDLKAEVETSAADADGE